MGPATATGRSSPLRPGSAPSRVSPRDPGERRSEGRASPLREARPHPRRSARAPQLSRAGEIRLSRHGQRPSDGDLILARIRFPDARRDAGLVGQTPAIGGGQNVDRRRRGRIRRALRVQAEGRANPASSGRRRGARRRAVRGRRAERARARSVRRRASSRRRCPKASTASPTRRTTPISPRSASCSRSIVIDRFKADTGAEAAARRAGRRRRGAARAHRGGGRLRPRPRQRARQCCSGRTRSSSEAVELAERFGASVSIGPRRRASRAPIFRSIHAVGRAAAEAAADRRFFLGPRGRAESDAGRQGRHLRHRRPRHQAGVRHGIDEEGHGRRRRRR